MQMLFVCEVPEVPKYALIAIEERENKKAQSYLAGFLYLTLVSSFDPPQAWYEKTQSPNASLHP
jgi:hypothetical protein